MEEGTLADILSGNDEFVYMRGYRFSRELTGQTKDPAALGARGGRGQEMEDGR